MMLEQKFDALINGEANTIQYEWVYMEDVSSYCPLAMIAAEDQNFFNHYGFDFQAIEKAIEHNKKKKKIRGASTITQQVAKNLFLWSGRSWIRKGLESYFTLLIELFWSKKRIIEMYINIAEMGKMTYGVKAVSKKYFHKKPKQISADEAALIASVLPNPKKYLIQKPSPYVLKRQSWILQQMEQIGGSQLLNKKNRTTLL